MRILQVAASPAPGRARDLARAAGGRDAPADASICAASGAPMAEGGHHLDETRGGSRGPRFHLIE